jgi:orotidine-5'-phosphate decarboxylase
VDQVPPFARPGQPGAPIAVAMDAPDLAVLRAWTSAVAPFVSTIKLGLEVYCRDGAGAVHAARQEADRVGRPEIGLFLDLKLHDIPATVAGAARAVAPLAPDFVTVHASGGPSMVQAAAQSLPRSRIAAVTVLTSLDEACLQQIGMAGPLVEAAVRLARLSVEAGARAIVCSPLEVAAVRAAVPDDIVLITPGVRPTESDRQDQRRVASAQQALADGANLLVVGRPITGAPDVGQAARRLADEIASAGTLP